MAQPGRSTEPSNTGRDRPIPSYQPTLLESVFGDHTRNRVFVLLCQHPNNIFLQLQIAQALGVSRAVVSRACRELVSYSVVERRRNAVDGRYDGYQLASTPATEKLTAVVRSDLEP